MTSSYFVDVLCNYLILNFTKKIYDRLFFMFHKNVESWEWPAGVARYTFESSKYRLHEQQYIQHTNSSLVNYLTCKVTCRLFLILVVYCINVIISTVDMFQCDAVD